MCAGYALYEVCAGAAGGAGERALLGAERVGDVLARWEKAGATAAACRYTPLPPPHPAPATLGVRGRARAAGPGSRYR